MSSFIHKHKKITVVFGVLFAAFLTSFIFARPLTYLALDVYDAYITPYNGECAYRVLNNGCSCSEYFRDIVDKKGVIPAIAAMPEQFYRCNMALQDLKLKAQEDQETMPACCVATACCAELMMTPVPIDSSSDSTLPQKDYAAK